MKNIGYSNEISCIDLYSMILNKFGIRDTDQHKDRHIIIISAILLLNLGYLFYTEFHFNTATK